MCFVFGHYVASEEEGALHASQNMLQFRPVSTAPLREQLEEILHDSKMD